MYEKKNPYFEKKRINWKSSISGKLLNDGVSNSLCTFAALCIGNFQSVYQSVAGKLSTGLDNQSDH